MNERSAGDTFAHLIRLHLDNDQGTYNERRRIVAEAIENAEADPYAVDTLGADRALALAVRSDAADALRCFVEELAFGADGEGSDAVTLLNLDLVSAALGLVDWFDMADTYIEEHDEDADTDA